MNYSSKLILVVHLLATWVQCEAAESPMATTETGNQSATDATTLSHPSLIHQYGSSNHYSVPPPPMVQPVHRHSLYAQNLQERIPYSWYHHQQPPSIVPMRRIELKEVKVDHLVNASKVIVGELLNGVGRAFHNIFANSPALASARSSSSSPTIVHRPLVSSIENECEHLNSCDSLNHHLSSLARTVLLANCYLRPVEWRRSMLFL